MLSHSLTPVTGLGHELYQKQIIPSVAHSPLKKHPHPRWSSLDLTFAEHCWAPITPGHATILGEAVMAEGSQHHMSELYRWSGRRLVQACLDGCSFWRAWEMSLHQHSHVLFDAVNVRMADILHRQKSDAQPAQSRHESSAAGLHNIAILSGQCGICRLRMNPEFFICSCF